jgi:A/G-specific adenine glycosylase
MDRIKNQKPRITKQKSNSGNSVNSVKRKICLVSLLLDWFSRNARDLPWRRTRDPYAIWVSEIMLQQTQVKTVIPYWERWMRELPTLQSLAKADPDKIHKLWEGLGYYTRVRNLQRAAQFLVTTNDGRFPDRFDDVLELPGIGRYTAGAICSIAFNQPTPILDGNVIRVLTRVFGVEKDPREKETNALLWSIAEELVVHASQIKCQPSARNSRTRTRTTTTTNAKSEITSHFALHTSHFNQSLMELGALICTPRQPLCRQCPIARLCIARREGRVEQLPNLGPRVAATARRFAAFIVRRDGRYLVRQRPEGVVNAHLWEFPNVEVGTNDSDLKTAARIALGFRPQFIQPLCTIKHSITRYRIDLVAFTVKGTHRSPTTDGSWHTLNELNQLSFPSAHRKILEQLSVVRGQLQ